MSKDFSSLIIKCPKCLLRLIKTGRVTRTAIIARMLAHLWKEHGVNEVEVEFKVIR